MRVVRMCLYGIVGGIGGLALFGIVTPVVASWHVRAGAGISHIPTTLPLLSLAAGVALGVWRAIR